jgi:hypothetical protein
MAYARLAWRQRDAMHEVAVGIFELAGIDMRGEAKELGLDALPQALLRLDEQGKRGCHLSFVDEFEPGTDGEI